MKTVSKTEKDHGRVEKRTAYVTNEIEWLEQRKEWKESHFQYYAGLLA